ncbi:MAG TPA: DUF3810 domain-containing protein [Clostridia bacterium]|nr:DUF3810 domain-containing protein [Clostridia bacterium]
MRFPKTEKKFSLADTGRFLLKAACVFCCTCFLFTILWGLNYCRRPLERNLGYTVKAPNSKLLENMMEEQTEAVNRLCRKIVFRQSGSVYPGGFQKIKDRVSDGYIQLSEKIRFVRKTPVHPKALILSRLMSYTDISGIFIPFTYEPCVDSEYPEFVLAFNTAHECAHFQGFAKEDEANYIAYLANTENPDPYFQYSAHMMALIYVSNALAQTDRTASNTIFKKLDSRAMGDLRSFNNFGKLHESPFQAISDRINDSYLKLQGQKGIESYDGFVDLLAMGYDEKMR